MKNCVFREMAYTVKCRRCRREMQGVALRYGNITITQRGSVAIHAFTRTQFTHAKRAIHESPRLSIHPPCHSGTKRKRSDRISFINQSHNATHGVAIHAFARTQFTKTNGFQFTHARRAIHLKKRIAFLRAIRLFFIPYFLYQ